MSDNQHDLVQHYLNTQEYLTIKIYDCYLLFHRNIIQQSNNHELGLGKKNKINKIRHSFKYTFFVLL